MLVRSLLDARYHVSWSLVILSSGREIGWYLVGFIWSLLVFGMGRTVAYIHEGGEKPIDQM